MAGTQLENIPGRGENILRGTNVRLGRQKYSKYNEINNNLEHFRGARFLCFAKTN